MAQVEWNRLKQTKADIDNALDGSTGQKIGAVSTAFPRLAYATASDLGEQAGKTFSKLGDDLSGSLSEVKSGIGRFFNDVYSGATGNKPAQDAGSAPAVNQSQSRQVYANQADAGNSQPVQAQLQTAKPPEQSGRFSSVVASAKAVPQETVRYGLGAVSNRENQAGHAALPKLSSGVNFAPQQGYGNSLAERFDSSRPFVASFGTQEGGLSDAQRKALALVSKPHAGAQNGQLTANQINAMRGIVGDAERNDADIRKEQIRNAANIQRDINAQNAQMQRDLINNRHADIRADRQNAIQQQQFADRLNFERESLKPKLEAAALQNRQQEILTDLQQQYANATTDETRNSIARKIGGIGGRFAQEQRAEQLKPSDYTQKISRPIYDPDTGILMGNRDDIVDLRTGRSILNNIPQGAIDEIRANPQLRAEAERKYGKDAVASALR